MDVGRYGGREVFDFGWIWSFAVGRAEIWVNAHGGFFYTGMKYRDDERKFNAMFFNHLV
jgi:hypothetical protein